MQKKFLILIVFAILLTACGIKATPTVNTPTTSAEPSATNVAETEEPTEEPVVEPTFNPYISVPLEELTQSVPIPLPEPHNKEFLSPVDGEEEGVYFVESDPSDMTLRNDRLPEVGYPVELNGTEADKVGAVVIEFDIEGSVAPLDNTYFGYDYGVFVGMYNSKTIPNTPAWNYNGNTGLDAQFLSRHGAEIDLEMMLTYHELAVDMQKYLQLDGNHYKYVIPYLEWQKNAAKYLCVQFAPETTFSNLSISVLVKEGVDPDIIDKITKPIEKSPDGSVLDEIPSEFLYPDSYDTDSAVLDKVYGEPLMDEGLVINPDGSISMPKSFHDLGEYADEVKGDYAVFPEGYVSVFMTLAGKPDLFTNEQVRQVADFMFEHMIDENGQFSGIYDIEQGKVVATDRKVPALPIVSAMLLRANIFTDDEFVLLLNSAVADVERVGDTLYYAPNGISDAGVMDFKLSDFAISNQLFNVFTMSATRGAFDDPEDIAILMEGYNNSLKLILEGQEQNATKLPSSELKVIFLEDGGYELQPSDTFDVNDQFFTMWLLSYLPFDQFPGRFPFIAGGSSSDSWKNSVRNNQDGSYSAKQEETIRKMTAMYSEAYNAFDSINTFYEICFNIKGFIDVQPVSTRYAPAYNVNTGEPIYAEPGEITSNLSEEMTAIVKRFGRPSGILNYLNIVGMTNDEAKVKETAALLLTVYDLYLNRFFMASDLDYTDPDLFAENFFYIWGGDSLKQLLGGALTPNFSTRFLYSTSGLSLNRENFKQWMLRSLNENRAEEHKLTMEDVIPLFYDHIPGAIIVETED